MPYGVARHDHKKHIASVCEGEKLVNAASAQKWITMEPAVMCIGSGS